MGQVGHELLPNRLEVAQPGYVSCQKNQGSILTGHRADLQDAARTGQFHLGCMLKPRLARLECQPVDSMVSNDLNQRTANWMLDVWEHQPCRWVEPPDLRPDQQEGALFDVVDDRSEHRARLGGIDRQLGSRLYRGSATISYRSPSPEARHPGRM